MHIICLSVKAHDHAVICILHFIADFVLLCNLTLFLHGLYTDITWQRFVTVKCVVLFVFVHHCHAGVSAYMKPLM